MNKLALIFIDFYKIFFSRFLFSSLGGCKYHPSCSQYAKECFLKFGFFKASKLAASRILRCSPFGNGGHDPLIQ